jgi:transcriptional regulator with XRE-family HTH domain
MPSKKKPQIPVIVPDSSLPATPAPQLVQPPEPDGVVLASHQIEGNAVESCISEKHIGMRIKALRLKKSMGLVDLGKHTGLSASFLSQLETGRVVPTLRNLARISMVFSKDLSYFFEPEPQSVCRVHRAKDRLRLPQTGVDEPMYYFESLGYLVPGRELDPYLAEFLPLGDAEGKPVRTPRPHQHEGCEFLYVVKGKLNLRHGEAVHELEAGDAIYFDSTTVHSYSCSGAEPATALIVTHQEPLEVAEAGNGSRRPARRELSGTDLTLLRRRAGERR